MVLATNHLMPKLMNITTSFFFGFRKRNKLFFGDQCVYLDPSISIFFS